jgi:hypothetical protein
MQLALRVPHLMFPWKVREFYKKIVWPLSDLHVVTDIVDLTPPRDSSNSGGFNDPQTGELLLLSGETPRGRASSGGISFTTTEPPTFTNQEDQNPFAVDFGAVELLQGDSTNHGASSQQQQQLQQQQQQLQQQQQSKIIIG